LLGLKKHFFNRKMILIRLKNFSKNNGSSASGQGKRDAEFPGRKKSLSGTTARMLSGGAGGHLPPLVIDSGR